MAASVGLLLAIFKKIKLMYSCRLISARLNAPVYGNGLNILLSSASPISVTPEFSALLRF